MHHQQLCSKKNRKKQSQISQTSKSLNYRAILFVCTRGTSFFFMSPYFTFTLVLAQYSFSHYNGGKTTFFHANANAIWQEKRVVDLKFRFRWQQFAVAVWSKAANRHWLQFSSTLLFSSHTQWLTDWLIHWLFHFFFFHSNFPQHLCAPFSRCASLHAFSPHYCAPSNGNSITAEKRGTSSALFGL